MKLGKYTYTPSPYAKLIASFWVQLWVWPQFFWFDIPVQIGIPLTFTAMLLFAKTIVDVVEYSDKRTHGTITVAGRDES